MSSNNNGGFKVEVRNNTLVIELPISPGPSKSGKSLVIATTRGNVTTSATHNGKPITLGVNAYTGR